MFLGVGDTLLAIVAFIIILGAIIIIHEGGHFYFAVKAGVLCREYAFGMGPILWRKKKGETTYSIRALPIGGFCAICGEEAESDPLKDLKKIRFEINLDGVITKIYLPTDGKNPVHLFDDIPEYKLVKYDLYDEADTGKLFITIENEDGTEKEISVARDASYVFGVGKCNDDTVSKEIRLKKYVDTYQLGPHDRTIDSKKFFQRFMVMFAGPMMNFILGIIVFFISVCIMGTANTKQSFIAPYEIEEKIEKIESNKNYVGVTDLSTKGVKGNEYSLYGYVVSVDNSIITLQEGLTTGNTIMVRLKADQQVSKYSYVLLNGKYGDLTINGETYSCLDSCEILKQEYVTSPMYIAGIRGGDSIKALECDSLKVTVNKWDDISNFMEDYEKLENKKAIKVTYLDSSEGNKEVTKDIYPSVYIYSISMVQDIGYEDVIIAQLNDQSKAYIAGLREGDEITSITVKDNTYEIKTWYDVYDCFEKASDGETEVTVKVSRMENGTEVTKECKVTPYSSKLFEKTQNVDALEIQIGVSCQTTRNIFAVIRGTFAEVIGAIVQLFNTLGMLLFSKAVGIKDLSGPVGIFSMTKSYVNSGIGNLFYWCGFLSINVGFMNLLPIPALDGGRILFLVIEKIKGSPVSRKAQDISINVTYYALLALILYVTIHDIMRLF